jgi:NAD(P)-dependent dehydrogenase (short-subunit alcohol dehydrogenase family)
LITRATLDNAAEVIGGGRKSASPSRSQRERDGGPVGLLEGKTAIVTGAGRGIGREEALLLAREGANVVVNDVGVDLSGGTSGERPADAVVAEIEAAGGRALANTDDVSSFDSAEAIVDAAVREFGSLDILVNNAGILRDKMSFNLDEQDFDDVVRVHLKGHFAMSRAAARHWRARHKAGEPVAGRIVNTTSEAGLYGSVGQANYAAAKGGIAALTLVLARELERIGVTVNAIAPRARTRMTESALGELVAATGGFDRWSPDNIAPVVAWLATDAAATITGQIFVVFGGELILTGGFEPVARLSRDQAWSVEELVDHQERLFEGRSSGLVPFPEM